MNESVTGSANFFGPMTIETATSREDLAPVAKLKYVPQPPVVLVRGPLAR